MDKAMMVRPRSTFQIIANTVEFIKTDGRGFKNGEAPPDDDVPF